MSASSRPSIIIALTITAAAAAAALGVAAVTTTSKKKSQKRTTTNYDDDNNDDPKKFQIPRALLDSPYAAELKLAVRLALQAGRNMYAYCDAAGTVHAVQDLGMAIKGGRPEDFCTQIDVDNEHIITSAIQTHFPAHHIIGEEAVGSGEIPSLSNDIPTWIIDPVDGTTNFAAGMPLTCVSIGYCVRGYPTVGVVYAPMTNELYLAVTGYGAYRNHVRLLVSSSTQKKKCLKDAIVCYEFGYERDPTAIAQMVGKVRAILEHGCRATRSLGSGVLNLCYVASGRLDVVYAGVAGEGWKPWDYCAGHVIATEAGCVVESFLAPQSQQPDEPPRQQQQQRPTETRSSFDLYSKTIICATSARLAQEVRSIVSS